MFLQTFNVLNIFFVSYSLCNTPLPLPIFQKYRTLDGMVARRLCTVILFALIFTLAAERIEAASFPADYDVVYTVGEDGKTRVEEKITITNETTDQYPSQYTLALEKIAVEDISASDAKGDMRIETEPRGDFTLITAHFNEAATGQGTILPWTLRYTTNKIAQKNGHVWDVTVPQIQRDDRIKNYKITLIVPESFGTVDYSDPFPVSYERMEKTKQLTYMFGPEESIIGVSASFGIFQLVDVSLVYHLHNPKLFTALTEVALPPSFAPYQKVFVNTLEPSPYGFRYDTDGNVFAQYRLSADEYLDVRFEGQILIKQFTLEEDTASNTIPDAHIYTRRDEFWETDNQGVMQAAEQIRASKGEDSKSIARAVYEYVTSTLSYDTKRLTDDTLLERKGAALALTEPANAICTDYTDLTIALMRKLGIPAREVNGFAFAGEEDELPTINDVLHAWVQIYLPEHGWVNIDPTWGSTSGQNYFDRFDTKHVIFSIRGQDSQYPFPAGSYKLPDTDTNDVEVAIAEQFAKGTLLPVWLQQWEEANDRLDPLDWIFRKLVGRI